MSVQAAAAAVGGGIPVVGTNKRGVLKIRFDASEYTLAQNDTVKLAKILAPCRLVPGLVKIVTPEGAPCTVDLGLSTTGVTDETLLAAASVNGTAGSYLTMDAADGDATVVVPFHVTADTYLTLTINSASTDTFVIDIYLQIDQLDN